MLMGICFEVRAEAALPPVVVSQVKDIDPGPDSGDPMQGGNSNEQFGGVDLNGVLIFDADVWPESSVELWRSDGTEAGTYMLKEINPGGFASSPAWFVEMNGEAFFTAAADSIEGTELWKTDGTESGTVLVKDINPDIVKSGSPRNLVDVNGTLYFLANSDDTNGAELWKSDGTEGGTVMVRDIESELATPAYNFIAVGDRLFFTFNNGTNGKELWTSDGTSGGTVMVKDINPGAAHSLPGPIINQLVSDYTEYNGELYFRADDGVNGMEPWKSDGTVGGTVMLKDIATFLGDGSMTGGAHFAKLGGELYFSTDFNFYETDGTTVGTVPLAGAPPGLSPTDTTNVDGTLYFLDDAYELYRSDGTGPGTQLVKDFADPSVPDGGPEDFVDFNGTLYFGFDEGAPSGKELWRSDGTLAGTERISDINPGAGDSNILQPTIVGDRLYFRGEDDGTTGLELWQAHSDVTPPETTIDSGPSQGAKIGKGSATFTFSSSETGSTFACVLDGGPPQACDGGSRTYSGLGRGTHTFSVAAIDQAPFSNVDPTPATRSFTVADTRPPELQLKVRVRQRNAKLLVLRASCVNEWCSLRASGRIRVPVLRPNGKFKRFRSFGLRPMRRNGPAGRTVVLKLRLKGPSRRLVKRVIRRRASTVTVTVRAVDRSGNSSTRSRRARLTR
jgi:ELWxxDGT repeat protein